MDPANLAGKLAGWCVLYAAGMTFIGLRIYARLHIFGSLTIDDWLMVLSGVFYTTSMVLEILSWIALTSYAIEQYLKVTSQLNCLSKVCVLARDIAHLHRLAL
jgi:hypothetical protein